MKIVQEPLHKDPTSQIESEIQKLFFKHESVLPTDLKSKLTPYHSKPLHLCGLPKIHKPDIPLRPIVSSTGGPCHALVGFLHILTPLIGNMFSLVGKFRTLYTSNERYWPSKGRYIGQF
jgi:hypothetical protein